MEFGCHSLMLLCLRSPLSEATSANLNRSYRNVPKAASARTDCTGICHMCLAGRPGFDYEDVHLVGHFFVTACLELCVLKGVDMFKH